MELVAGLIVAAIVGAVATWVSTSSANEQSQINQSNQNSFNAEQAKIAREWDAPENQMQRFMDAGINPAMAANAITGQNTIASPVAQGGQGSQVFPFDPSALTKLTSQFNELSQANNTNKNTEWIDTLNDAKQKEIIQNIQESISRENLNDTQAAYYLTSAREMVRMNNQQLINLQTTNRKDLEAISLIQEQIKNTSKATDVLDKDIEVKNTEIESMQSSIAKNESDIAKNQSDITRNEKLNEVSNADIAEKLSAAGLNQAATIVKGAEFNLTNAESRKTLAEAITTELKSQLASKGMFVDSSVWNNIITVMANNENQSEFIKPITDFLEFLDHTAQTIINGISDMNSSFIKGEEKSRNNIGNNIYGKSWNSGRPIYNPNVTNDTDYPYR